MNVKPICNNPQDGSLSTGGGLRLCTNPTHRQEPDFAARGPVWHRISEWPANPSLELLKSLQKRHVPYPNAKYGEL